MKDLTNYKPYSIVNQSATVQNHIQYADIAYESEGLMTIPKNSASTIVDLLNEAFKNGVKMALKNGNISGHDDFWSSPEPIKFKPMPLEESHPINYYKKIKK